MTRKDLKIIDSLLERVDNLPDILHLRAAPVGYKFTPDDKILLQDTYQKLDDILKELAAFINVKFPGRRDYIEAWNKIDFDTKIGGIKVITTDREHIKSEWKVGIFDLKSLLKSIRYEIALLVDAENENVDYLKPEAEWDKYIETYLNNRVSQADFFLDIIREKGLLNLDKPTLQKYFKQWFKENQEFDLQIKNGDFAIEDGDIQIIPDFNKDNIPEFLKWFEVQGEEFLTYLKEHGVKVNDISKEEIVNHGNMIINKDSKISKQVLGNDEKRNTFIWTKAGVIVAVLVGVVTIIGVIWSILH